MTVCSQFCLVPNDWAARYPASLGGFVYLSLHCDTDFYSSVFKVENAREPVGTFKDQC